MTECLQNSTFSQTIISNYSSEVKYKYFKKSLKFELQDFSAHDLHLENVMI